MIPVYRPIKSRAQYKCYQNYLHKMLQNSDLSEEHLKQIDQLNSFIINWEMVHPSASDLPKTTRRSYIEVLERLIRENNITPSELATRLGISQSRISDILYYGQELTEDLVSKISQIFNLSGDIFRNIRNPKQLAG